MNLPDKNGKQLKKLIENLAKDYSESGYFNPEMNVKEDP